MMRNALAYWVIGRNQGELRGERLPAPAADDVLVTSLFGAISRGTEALVHRGAVPESQQAIMRAPFQEGDFPWPVKYGYSNVGRVEEGPDALRGQKVFSLFPHQDAYVLPADAVLAVPGDVPPERAVLAANMETAVNALWDGSPALGDRVAVIGGGLVGTLTAYLAAGVSGSRVDLAEPDVEKHAAIDALDLKALHPSEMASDYDVVFHASGNPQGLREALRLAAFEARIVEISWYGDQQVSLPLGEAFHARRLTIRSSQVGHVAPSHRSRWSRKRRLALALSLLTDPRLDALVTGECAFDDLPKHLPELLRSARGTFCERIRYTG